MLPSLRSSSNYNRLEKKNTIKLFGNPLNQFRVYKCLFTSRKSEGESEKDQRKNKKIKDKADREQRQFSLSLSLSLGLN